ncbi:MAG TPA: histidine kinase [Erythrobacter sp.]|jgi:two-component sensor histidine kinase|uniref:histidine kinase n=2 Tax=Erythrobacteraceae TaxID=335929 RepID=A0A0L1KAP0_9SPHN|nr:CHASE3 domain-containing protein [Qipengyuania citrea]MBN91494.1 histidine kinase [Erythrobacteraceae bacterium]MCZ4263852.1 CHASE3 domain-containing protein [Erythrobacter sp. G21629-S1]HAL90654.1 histidine kinase [Erythrobacter sp.]KNH00991.1 HWE histidine kinase [Qipengyuania citrea LAMA 915]MDP7326568.1 CHASE3 domain-containing protein [Qipengyuania citrea]|tara:strand:+ start:845 stop:2077 length:1233 start_codon:yes stop_codon:yes gene_type:complete
MNVVLLGVIAAAMFATLFLVYQTVEAEREQREQVRRTVEVLEELRQVSRSAISGETGQRGYLITLDRRYLAPYQAGREQIDPTLDRIRELIGEDATARQTELIDKIDALARAKFDEMATGVELLENGRLLDARRAILTDEGVETMERLDRAIAELEDIENETLAAYSADAARTNARVLPLLGALLVFLIIAMFAGARLVGRAARAEAEAAQAAVVSEARDRADLLARELNHRVKNLFAVVLAIVQMSARDKPEAKEVTNSIAQRIRALLTAHEVSQGELERPVASLRALVETSLAPYRSSNHPAEIDGPEIMLPAKRVTPLGLVLHELTTNAVKYGAWKDEGTVHVSWSEQDGTVTLEWRETGAQLGDAPEHTGFGSLLMTSAARQFGGTFERKFTPDGLIVTIELPAGD